jgi:hypothetical protein
MDSSEAISVVRRGIRGSILRILGKGHTWEIDFDLNQGIPTVNYGVRYGVCVGRRINPAEIAIYALKQLGLESVTGPLIVPRIKETERPQYVQRVVDWLISNEKQRGDFSVWECDFHGPYRDLKPPWRSALTEGFGALLLLATGRTEYAYRHLKSMTIDYREGGVAYIDNGYSWLLEYVCEKPPLVLNCMMHCLLILQRCNLVLKDSDLARAFEVGYRTMKRNLRLFDAGFYTFYDSRKNPADQKYHKIHVELLRLFYKRTKDEDLLPWIDRWVKFQKTYALLEPVIFLLHLFRSGGSLIV